ncbi:MAG TPA: site-specific integrase [Candidatus Merdibacter merdigallinarum]|nr:site-specific integrase [Candidatus Merdibacter merdigallinarum]
MSATVYVQDSLAQRGKESWRLSYHCVDEMGRGDRLYETIKGCKTKHEAELAAKRLLAAKTASEMSTARSQCPSLRDLYLELMSRLWKTRSIEESSYKDAINASGRLSLLGEMKVDEILERDVVSYVADLVHDGYMPKTISMQLKIVKRTLRFAVKEGWCSRNVAEDVKAPPAGKTRPRCLNERERLRLLAVTSALDGPVAVAIRILLSTGARRGEVCALTWNDIDFENETLYIGSAIASGLGDSWYVKLPKSSAGERTLPLEPGLAEVLLRRREEMRRRCAAAGVSFDGALYVIGDVDGSFMKPSVLGRRFVDIVRAANIADGKCTLHWLRHTFATSLLSSGVDVRTVAGWLGHADPGFTLRVYVDLDQDAMKRSVSVVSRITSLPDGYASSVGLPEPKASVSRPSFEECDKRDSHAAAEVVKVLLPCCTGCEHADKIAVLLEAAAKTTR